MADVRYADAFLVGAVPEDLDRWLGGERPAEIMWDEVSIAATGSYEHRLLLDPDGEFGIRFASLNILSAIAQASQRR